MTGAKANEDKHDNVKLALTTERYNRFNLTERYGRATIERLSFQLKTLVKIRNAIPRTYRILFL